jgi:hypothetical protein
MGFRNCNEMMLDRNDYDASTAVTTSAHSASTHNTSTHIEDDGDAKGWDFDAPRFKDFSTSAYQRQRRGLDRVLFRHLLPPPSANAIDADDVIGGHTGTGDGGSPFLDPMHMSPSRSSWFDRKHECTDGDGPRSPPQPLITPNPCRSPQMSLHSGRRSASSRQLTPNADDDEERPEGRGFEMHFPRGSPVTHSPVVKSPLGGLRPAPLQFFLDPQGIDDGSLLYSAGSTHMHVDGILTRRKSRDLLRDESAGSLRDGRPMALASLLSYSPSPPRLHVPPSNEMEEEADEREDPDKTPMAEPRPPIVAWWSKPQRVPLIPPSNQPHNNVTKRLRANAPKGQASPSSSLAASPLRAIPFRKRVKVDTTTSPTTANPSEPMRTTSPPKMTRAAAAADYQNQNPPTKPRAVVSTQDLRRLLEAHNERLRPRTRPKAPHAP